MLFLKPCHGTFKGQLMTKQTLLQSIVQYSPVTKSELTQHDHEVPQQERCSLPSPQPLHLGQPSSTLDKFGVLVFTSCRSEEKQKFYTTLKTCVLDKTSKH